MGLTNQGTFDGGGGAGLLSGTNCIIDLSQGTLKGVGSMSVDMGANSLLLLPAGFNTATGFGSYISAGLTHTAGTILTVPAGKGFVGADSINDPVVRQGTIAAAGNGVINLGNGLVLSGNGSVNLGGGSLTVNDPASGISGGLSGGQSICRQGRHGTVHTRRRDRRRGQPLSRLQRGRQRNLQPLRDGQTDRQRICRLLGRERSPKPPGAIPSRRALYLAYNVGSSGVYNLGGTGQITGSAAQFVGYAGTGTFIQSGGTNAISSGAGLYLGSNATGSGTYILTDNGQLSAMVPVRWIFRRWKLHPVGGTNTISSSLYLGQNSTGNGTYRLSDGGELSAASEYVGPDGRGTFTQSGGSNATSGSLRVGNSSGSTGTYNQSAGSNAAANLYLGCAAAASGTYQLSWSGQLSAANQYVGDAADATAWFQQSGGTNTASYLSIGSGGQYQLSGGTLQDQHQRTGQPRRLQRRRRAGTLNAANCIVDLSQGTLQNVGSLSVNTGANSCCCCPPDSIRPPASAASLPPGWSTRREPRWPCRPGKALAAGPR